MEEGLNCMPAHANVVITPTGMVIILLACHALCMLVCTHIGQSYEGTKFDKMNCAVSIIRSGLFIGMANTLRCYLFVCWSGEAMERGVRDCCRSIRIGKILIRRDPETKAARVRSNSVTDWYSRFHQLTTIVIVSSG